MKYVIIMPAYNESAFIKRTLNSICNQQLTPSLLIVVDDGSTDETPAIVRKYVSKYDWIKLVQLEKSTRAVGSKVVLAFNAGYAEIPATLDHEYIVKLDADLELPSDYFARVTDCFLKYTDVGICGGYCIVPYQGGWRREKTAPMHIRGAFKAIRSIAFKQIGGFQPVLGWDGIDQTRLLFNGWKFGILNIPVKHFRPTGAASVTKDLFTALGESRYLCGYDLLLSGLAAVKIATRRKNFRIIHWTLQGYLRAVKKKQTRYLSKDEIRFLRNIQYRRILSEKSVLEKYSYSDPM